MPRIYLIGGAPRVGKTSASLKAIERHPMLATSSDALRYVLRRVVSAEQSPGLFTVHNFAKDDTEMAEFLNQRMDEVMTAQKAENLAVWKSVKDYIMSNSEDGFDVLVEGIHIEPAFLQELADYDVRAVFMGNTSTEHVQAVLEHAKESPDDWLNSHSQEVIEGWAKFTKDFSSYIQSEAVRFNLSYIEMHDDQFEAQLDETVRILLVQ